MTTAWRSLLWKEWREQRWILAGILAVAAFVPVPFTLGDLEGYRAGLAMVGLVFIPLSSLFVGVWIAAGEQSRGTIDFLQALPIRMSLPARAKLVCGSGIVLAPGLIGCILLAILGWQYHPSAPPRDLGLGVIIAITLSLLPLSALLWTAALGANVRDEVRAGVIGLSGICVCWALLALVGYVVTPENKRWPTWLMIMSGVAPGGPGLAPTFFAYDLHYAFVPFAALTLVSHATVALVFICRFGRVAPRGRFVTASAGPEIFEHPWRAPPRKSALAATVWKQWRETGPLAGTGSAANLGIIPILAMVMARLEPSSPRESAIHASFIGWGMMGYAVAIVCGISVLRDDLRPSLHTFWRSRPIRLGQWFTAKLVTSLLVTAASLAAPALVISLMQLTVKLIGGPHYPSLIDKNLLALSAASLAIQLCGFLVAVAATALLRSATAAALSTLLLTALAGYLADKLDLDPRIDLPYFVEAAAFVVATSIAAAWLGLKKDWCNG